MKSQSLVSSRDIHIRKTEGEQFINKLIDDNFENYMDLFGFQLGFDKFKVREMLFKDFVEVFRFLENLVRNVYGPPRITGTYETLINNTAYKLGWIQYTGYDSLESQLSIRILQEKNNSLVGQILQFLPPLKDYYLELTDEEISKGKNEIHMTPMYSLTKTGEDIMDLFLQTQGTALNRVQLHASNTRLSIADTVI